MPKPPRPATTATDRLSLRLDLSNGLRVGPGKVALLEAIGRTGSISAAGRSLRMSYRRAWQLVEDLNSGLAHPVVAAAVGGAGGGGARLTAAGLAMVAEYRAIESAANALAGPHFSALAAALPAADQNNRGKHAKTPD